MKSQAQIEGTASSEDRIQRGDRVPEVGAA